MIGPDKTQALMQKQHGEKAWASYQQKNEAATQTAQEYKERLLKEKPEPLYIFGQGVLHAGDMDISSKSVAIADWEKQVELDFDHPLDDWMK